MRLAGLRVPSIEPSDFPTNRGGLCSKGWSAAELLGHPDRLTVPLVRSDSANRCSPLRAASWAEALDRIVTAIRRSQEIYGHDSVGCFGGGGLTNEKAYQLGKFQDGHRRDGRDARREGLRLLQAARRADRRVGRR
jgi:assimilatory nitrate reductase catalytic subunit